MMESTECPACHGKEIDNNGFCTTCGFNVKEYSSVSEHEKGLMLYNRFYSKGVIRSKKVERGEMGNATHESVPIRKRTTSEGINLDVRTKSPECSAPNSEAKKTTGCGGEGAGWQFSASERDLAKALEKTNELLSGIQTKMAEKKRMSWFSVCSAVFVAVLLWSEVQGCSNKIKEALTPSPVYRY